MKKKLNLKKEGKLYHFVNGLRIEGIHKDISRDVSGLRGTALDISRDVSGLRGTALEIMGNINKCDISDEERKAGIEITDLIENEIKGDNVEKEA